MYRQQHYQRLHRLIKQAAEEQQEQEQEQEQKQKQQQQEQSEEHIPTDDENDAWINRLRPWRMTDQDALRLAELRSEDSRQRYMSRKNEPYRTAGSIGLCLAGLTLGKRLTSKTPLDSNNATVNTLANRCNNLASWNNGLIGASIGDWLGTRLGNRLGNMRNTAKWDLRKQKIDFLLSEYQRTQKIRQKEIRRLQKIISQIQDMQ